MEERTVTASRQLTDPTVHWRAEAGTIDPSDPTFELVQLVAKSVAVRCQGTAEIAQDSPNFGAQLMAVMHRSLAQEIDRVGLIGSGESNERSEEHTSELQSLMRISYAVFGLNKQHKATSYRQRCINNSVAKNK